MVLWEDLKESIFIVEYSVKEYSFFEHNEQNVNKSFKVL